MAQRYHEISGEAALSSQGLLSVLTRTFSVLACSRPFSLLSDGPDMLGPLAKDTSWVLDVIAARFILLRKSLQTGERALRMANVVIAYVPVVTHKPFS